MIFKPHEDRTGASGHFLPQQTTLNKESIWSQKWVTVHTSLKKTRERTDLSALPPWVVFHTGDN